MKCLVAALLVTLLGVPLPDGDGAWSIEKPLLKIPDKPLTGSIFGRAFAPGEITINKHALTIKSNKKMGNWPESELTIFCGTDDKAKEWTVTPDSEGMLPHVHMKFGKKGKTFPGTLMYTGEYSMRLEFISITKTEVKGKLHISLPDYKKSHLIGAFTAKVR
jgi:hypothetical protein